MAWNPRNSAANQLGQHSGCALVRQLLLWSIGGLFLSLCGCGAAAPAASSSTRPLPGPWGESFEPERSAVISGQVFWEGPLPKNESFVWNGPGANGTWSSRPAPNPYIPDVNADSSTVRDAVVFLESVDPSRSAPWPHGRVQVRVDDDALWIMQDERRHHVGLVRIGDEIELLSTCSGFESLSGRGATFFALTFPASSRPQRRRLDREGVVEIASAAGNFWKRGHLLIAPHPYYCRTDGHGGFVLPNVPPGDYRLVCWLPNPSVAAVDRDPNMGQVIRQHHSPPIERYQMIEVRPGSTNAVAFFMGFGR